MNLNLLEFNCNQLFTYLNSPATDSCLVANREGYIYPSNAVFLVNFIFKKGNVKQALEKTVLLFLEVKRAWLDPYFQILQDQCYKMKVDEKKAHLFRKNLDRWQESIMPLVEKFENPDDKVSLFIQTYFTKNPFEFPEREKWNNVRAIIDLECASASLLPFHDLMLLSRSITQVSQDFTKWMERFKGIGERTEQRTIHRGLKAAVETIKEAYAQTQYQFSVVELEVAMWGLGYKDILLQEDGYHLKWSEQLRVGSQLGRYTLTKEISPRVAEKNQRRVFEIKERDDALIFIPQNCAVLHMRDYVAKKGKTIVAEVLEIDPEGRFALIEKLDTLVKEEDLKFIPKQVKIIRYFLSLDWTPTIHLEAFGYNKKGELKSTKPFSAKGGHFNRIEEELIFTHSKPEIYRALVEQSGMHEHRYFKFYRFIFEGASLGCELNIKDLAKAKKIDERTIIERAEELYNEVIEFRRQLVHKLADKHPKANKKKVEILTVQTLLDCYDHSFGVGRLLESCKDSIREKIEQLQFHDVQ